MAKYWLVTWSIRGFFTRIHIAPDDSTTTVCGRPIPKTGYHKRYRPGAGKDCSCRKCQKGWVLHKGG